jgi:membrane protease YdiL (CAAX protease family)
MKQFLQFTFLLLILSIPFWVMGAYEKEFINHNPMRLPISALMTFCPLIAAVILSYQKKQNVYELVKLSFDYKKILNKKWLIPILLIMPTIALFSYFYKHINHKNEYGTSFSVIEISIFFILYFIGAMGEEIGWSGFATEPLQNKFGTLKASVILGSVWAIWHIVPYIQMSKTATWILLQCLSTVLLRVIMFWIFNNTGKSVFAMILFHTTINLSPYLIPNNGVNFEPIVLLLALLLLTVLISYLWGTKTFANYKFKKITT